MKNMRDKKKYVAKHRSTFTEEKKSTRAADTVHRCYQKHCSGDSRRQEQRTVLGTNQAPAEPLRPQLWHLMVCWRLKSFGMLRCIKRQTITDVSKDRSASYTGLDRLTQTTKALLSIETSLTICQHVITSR